MKTLPHGCFLGEMVTTSQNRLGQLRASGQYTINLPFLAESFPVRPFGNIFSGSGIAIIGEVKPVSPAEGRFNYPGNLSARVNEYAENGVKALSILTEPTRFGGSNESIAEARSAGIPVLRKDFIIAPEQVVESRILGADAILLIVSILSPNELSELIALSNRLSMAALVEVHSEEELHEAVDAGAKIIGINNRDIKTLKINVVTSLKLLPLVPAGISAVSESGVSTREQVVELEKAGAKGILIGSAFMRTENPGVKIRELLGEV